MVYKVQERAKKPNKHHADTFSIKKPNVESLIYFFIIEQPKGRDKNKIKLPPANQRLRQPRDFLEIERREQIINTPLLIEL